VFARSLIVAAAFAVPAGAVDQPKPAQPQAAAQAAPQTMNKADFLKQVDARFAAIDTNRDGSISKDEVAAMQAKALAEAQANEQKQLEASFKKLDTNKDNALSLAEFRAAAPPLRARQTADQMLAELDTNKDGKVTSAEYRNGPLAGFDKADANHDGTLTAQELAAARKR
jgi:Ca2+-binding EF-hand superfamily protein